MREIITSTVPPVNTRKVTTDIAGPAVVRAPLALTDKVSAKHPPMRLDTSAISAERRIVLRGYQQEAVDEYGTGITQSRILAWDMRTGKTPTAIELDKQLRRSVGRQQRGNNCTLICAPKSALSVWEDHLLRLGISPHCIRVIDLPSKKKIRGTLGYIQKNKRLKSMREAYIIVNWDAIPSLRGELVKSGPWWHIIGDEIHSIKGRKTKRTEAFKKIRCKQKTGLSGTPADNRPEEFWQILNWILPGRFSSYWRFVDDVCEVEVTHTGFKKIIGVKKDRVAAMHEVIAPYYSRVRMADVHGAFTEPQRAYWYVDMGARQRKEYDALVSEDLASIQGGDMIASLPIHKLIRQQQMAIGCCSGKWIVRRVRDKETGEMVEEDFFDVSITDDPPSPKLDMIMDYLLDPDNIESPVCIFAQHQDTVRLLNERCIDAGIKTAYVTGLTKVDDRPREFGAFQSGECRVFIGTIGTCRQGIDLSRGNTIIRTDKVWNPSWNKQLEARCDAVGKVDVVQIIDIVCRDSVDNYRIDKIDRKDADIEMMVG